MKGPRALGGAARRGRAQVRSPPALCAGWEAGPHRRGGEGQRRPPRGRGEQRRRLPAPSRRRGLGMASLRASAKGPPGGPPAPPPAESAQRAAPLARRTGGDLPGPCVPDPGACLGPAVLRPGGPGRRGLGSRRPPRGAPGGASPRASPRPPLPSLVGEVSPCLPSFPGDK